MTRSTRVRQAVSDWIDRHEVAWELVMGALAILYVLLGHLIDEGTLPPALGPIETSVTIVFLAEYGLRLWAASSRAAYVRHHLPDLIALLPAVRGMRVIRLLRLVRFARTVPIVYRRVGLDRPVARRLSWHLGRVREHADVRLLGFAGLAVVGFVLFAAATVTLLEKSATFEDFSDAVYWAANMALGSGDPSYVVSPLGRVLGWLLIILALTLVAVATGILVGFIIDVALKEGRGMGAAGYRDHVVVCGWNASARDFIDEIRGDEYQTKVVLLCGEDRNPAGSEVYFVHGDPTDPKDLERAGIEHAAAALIVPADRTDQSDMQSILVVLGIKSIAPGVRTIVEVNNSRHVEHFRRAHADEILIPTQITAHLAARTALYPGLTDLIMDIVSGGEGSELYRIRVPAEYVGCDVDEFAVRLLREHHATLMAIGRDGKSIVNPPASAVIEPGDDALVVAESIATLVPLTLDRATPTST